MSRILRTESYQKGIVISTSFNFLSKGLLFFNSVLIAYYFGAQVKTDIYFFIFSSVNFLIYFFYLLNTGVLIPESMRLREQKGEKESMGFLNRFLHIYLVLSVIVLLVFSLFPIEIFKMFSKFSLESLHQNITLIYLGTPIFVLMLLTNYFTEILASYRFFSMPMIAQFINNSFVLLFLLGLHSVLDIQSIFFGLLLAYSINIIMLLYLMKKRLKWSFLYKKATIKKKVWIDVFFAQAGNFASLLGNLTPNYLFSSMSGILTSLNFGQKTANMPVDLISGQFTAIAGIRFNELFSKQDYNQINIVFRETVKSLFFILIPIAGFISLFANEIIQFLYMRGRFSQEIATISAFYLRYFVILIPFLAFMGVITRLIISSQQIRLNFYIQITINLLLILLIFLGIRFYSYEGYAWAMIVSVLFQLLLTLAILKIKFSFIKILEVFKFVLIICLQTSIILLINFFFNKYVINEVQIIYKLTISFVLFAILYVLLTYLLNLRFELINQVYKKLNIRN